MLRRGWFMKDVELVRHELVRSEHVRYAGPVDEREPRSRRERPAKAALTRHGVVRNTVELHAAVLDELLGSVDLTPVGAAGDWRDRLEDVLRSYARVLFEYPELAQAELVAR